MAREKCFDCESKVNRDERYCPNCGADVHLQRAKDIDRDRRIQ